MVLARADERPSPYAPPIRFSADQRVDQAVPVLSASTKGGSRVAVISLAIPN